jgi:hypothetical protein
MGLHPQAACLWAERNRRAAPTDTLGPSPWISAVGMSQTTPGGAGSGQLSGGRALWRSIRLRARAATVSACWCAATGCSTAGSTPSSHTFEVVIEVHGDPGEAVADAELRLDGKAVGRTDASGRVGLRIVGPEGQSAALLLSCPEGYAATGEPITVALRRLADPGLRPRLLARCAPTVRSVVIAVRAAGAADLPVRYLGEELVRTDRSGAAHALLRVAPGERLELQLDTTAQPDLRPRNPTAVFDIPDEDVILLFAESFTREPKPRRAVVKPKGPTRI